MARVYADLIRKGKINIENVPVKIRTEGGDNGSYLCDPHC